MNKRFLGVLAFAFVVASVASLLLYRLLINRAPAAKAAPTTVQIALAARDIEVGAVLKESDIRMADWPGAAPGGAILKIQDAVGRGVTAAVVAKEPILESRLAPKGAGGGLAATIPPGMRAVAIRVNEVVGVAGFVVPGMRVDVLVSGNRPGGSNSEGTVTRTLLQNLEVLSAGQDFKKDTEGKPVMVQVVNLLVSPEQAEQLSLAANMTTIQLVLRNPLDRDVVKTPGTALSMVLGGRPAPAAPRARAPEQPRVIVREAPPKREEFVMEIIQGNKKAQTKFESSGEGK
jgi:pilus assembly protein CpaB